MSLPAVPAFHRLPPEILSMIIDAYCSDGRDLISLPFPSPATGVVCVARVCRQWMALAYDAPRLWTRYHLEFRPTWTGRDHHRLDGLVHAFGMFLAHAGSRGLRLEIVQPRQDVGRDAIVEILARYSRCIASLRMHIPEKTVNSLSTGPTIPFDRLGDLKIVMHPKRYEKDQRPMRPNLLAASPLVTCVDLSYCQCQPMYLQSLALDECIIPLAQLTTFHATRAWMQSMDCIRILRECPQLIDCSLYCDADTLPDPVTEPFMLQHLCSLEIQFRVLDPTFWQYITTPNLVNLSITTVSEEKNDSWDQEYFMSGFRLRSFSLSFDFTDFVDWMIEILEASPDLVRLCLRWTQVFAEADPEILDLLARLTCHHDQSLFLPNLRSIAIDATEESLRMLRSRCVPQTSGDPPRLKTVILYAEAPFDPDTLFARQIKSLRKKGLEVTLQEMDFYGAKERRDDFVGRECVVESEVPEVCDGIILGSVQYAMAGGKNEDENFQMDCDREL
ncbi:hypothetical protein DFH09DRAFT_1367527 [Mycena vulgaris]|nr:hypothetical protein DFH09DRAFT_1367527 [Mycena vulgaris]